MRDELEKYATYTFMYKKKQSFFFSDISFGILLFVMLIISSVPMLITKWLLWSILIVSMALIFMCTKKEKGVYMKAIVMDGVFAMYSSVFLSYVVILSPREPHYSYMVLLMLSMIIFWLLIYEIFVATKIKRKIYSKRDRNIVSSTHKKSNNKLIAILSCIGAFLGIVFSKLTSKFMPWYVKQILPIIIISLVWICGIVLLQKYIILKLMKKNI